MYSQSDRFPLPVLMMGFWESVQEQVTATKPLFKHRANKRRSEDDSRIRNSVGKERS